MDIEQPYQTFEKPLAVVASHSCKDGYELAKQFAKNGYDLIVAANNPSVVEEAEDFKEFGIDAVSFQLDLSSAEGVEQLYTKIIATGRPVEAIVISNGLGQDLMLAKKVFNDMNHRGRGHILFAGDEIDDEADSACETLFEEAKGSGVTIIALKKDDREIYFLKKGYESEDKKLLH